MGKMWNFGRAKQPLHVVQPVSDVRIAGPRRKSDFAFVHFSDPRWSKTGHWGQSQDCIIGSGRGASITWNGEAIEVIALVIKHPWSGIVEVSSSLGRDERIDLHSWVHHQVPITLCALDHQEHLTAKLEIVGRNSVSKSEQLVFMGAFVRTNEPPAQKEFTEVQHAQVQTWVANIEASGRTLADVTVQRQAAYLQRWAEASPYMPNGSKLLDIGCGHFWPGLFEYIEARNIDYTGLDIDPDVTEWNTWKAKEWKKDEFSFIHGSNDNLPFEDSSFDFVFSSHSIEHSRDLTATFRDLLKVMRPGAFFLFAVPLNVDTADEHMWIITQEEWIAHTENSGFLVRNVHIGNVYPEIEYDLVIVAQKPI
jgi:SAM-dependent methyltransferase